MSIRRDYTITRGDDAAKPIVLARAVYDAVVTKGSTTVTSATAAFATAQDAGIVVLGAGIPDGTTISSVGSATSVTLSAAATASNILTRAFPIPNYEPLRGLVILSRDVSGWTYTSKIRKEPQSSTVLASVTVTQSNAVKGQLIWAPTHAITVSLPKFCAYDIQGVRTSDGFVETIQSGLLTVSPDSTR